MPSNAGVHAKETPIRVERVARSRQAEIDFSKLPFGTIFSDHMFVAEFHEGHWAASLIRPYGPLPLVPSITALQYGASVFEGLKAHRSPAGHVSLFRPLENARRLQRSAARLAMPEVPEPLFLEGLRELVRVDEAWVPPSAKGSLYVRPVLFSADPSIRVKPAERFLFVIFTCPVGPYFAAPVEALVSDRYVRAFRGGTGDTKPAGNYAPGFPADQQAREQGFNTVLWLDGIERRYVEECGVMNVFFVLRDRIVTPELTGTILPGVTRDSVSTLLREMGHRVEERRISMNELLEAHGRGELLECFGTGTAAVVAHVSRIRYRDQDVVLPEIEQRAVGPAVRERLVAIMSGRAPDPYGWLDRVC